MAKVNARNERLKHAYLNYLRDAQGQNESSVVAAAKSLARFEAGTKYMDFGKFHFEQARAFKRNLATQLNAKGTGPLSKATQHATLGQVKAFFTWLAGQPGFRAKLKHSDMAYFKLSANDARVATARRVTAGPPLEQVRRVILAMPATTPLEMRDRAVVAFTLLTIARDSATASMRLKHVDIDARRVDQDARDVDTKFSKTFKTDFYPVGDDMVQILADWIRYLRTELGWGNEDPLFPATQMGLNADHRFAATGLAREPWRSAAAIRGIFKKACARAGVPYFNPHVLRNTVTQLGETLCQSPEELKAWSQNMGHDDVLTTLKSYGTVSPTRQAEIIRGFARRNASAVAHSRGDLDVDHITSIVKQALEQERGRGLGPGH